MITYEEALAAYSTAIRAAAAEHAPGTPEYIAYLDGPRREYEAAMAALHPAVQRPALVGRLPEAPPRPRRRKAK